MARNHYQEFSPQLAYDAAEAKANRQMRAAGRAKWNAADYGLACDMQNALVAKCGTPLQRLAALTCLGRMDEVAVLRAQIKSGEVRA